jgi:predicted MFS family arabinose efflux permease
MSPATRRLMPLYISSFLQSLPFWYAIEKLFMTSIGFDIAAIGMMVAVMTTVSLLVETPSGILADRWSRKGVMLLGCTALLASALVGGLSYGVPMFLVSTVFWGIYNALYSGTYDSVIYDVALEEDGNAGQYEKYLGRLRAVEGAGFVAGALGGGLLANHLGMRETFFLTIPLVLAGGLYLLRFRESTLHKSELAEPMLRHIRQTFAAVLRRRILVPVIIATVGVAVLMDAVYELGQLWFIAVSTPLALYGVISALVFSTWAIGGLLAPRLHTRAGVLAVFGVVLAGSGALIMSRNYWILLAAQVLMGTCLVALSVVLARKLQDELPSRLRAGSSSVMGTLASLVIIPGSIVFTLAADRASIFTASYMLLGLAVVTLVAYLAIRSTSTPLPATDK